MQLLFEMNFNFFLTTIVMKIWLGCTSFWLAFQKVSTHFEHDSKSTFKRCGLQAVEKAAQQGENVDPKAYIDALLEVHTRYNTLVTKAFNGESEFVRALDNACREYVNRNKVCDKNSARSPELLAKHSDNVLKRSTKSSEEDDMEKSLIEVMTIFKYIEDKDVFQKFYSRSLAKRLVHGTSASGDSEVSMISKLKDASGFEYTNKLNRMYQDIQLSKDLNKAYEQYQSNSLSGDGGEMRANYVKMNKVPYTFQVSTYQISILLLFNDSDTVSYDDIASTTMLAKETLDPSLAIMLKAKVLLATPEGKTESGVTYTLNKDFKHKKIKVNLNIAIKSEQKQEVEETHKTIEEDRKMLMQSAIVRIMKSRKTMKHSQLVSETIQQIKSRFSPKVGDIKKCIDILLEKEYLERLDGDELGYLA
ncbi:hypothetical protein MRB53_038965 [Persea americana]|nr:hypothetical protein MRB53_038965 [Persea americana]